MPGYERQSGRGAKKEILFLNVSLVCPEPVLATCGFVPRKLEKRKRLPFFRRAPPSCWPRTIPTMHPRCGRSTPSGFHCDRIECQFCQDRPRTQRTALTRTQIIVGLPTVQLSRRRRVGVSPTRAARWRLRACERGGRRTAAVSWTLRGWALAQCSRTSRRCCGTSAS